MESLNYKLICLSRKCTNLVRNIFINVLGPHANDEMCNLYFMYYTKIDDGGFKVCELEESGNVTKTLNLDSDTLWSQENNQNRLVHTTDHFTSSKEDSIQRLNQMM